MRHTFPHLRRSILNFFLDIVSFWEWTVCPFFSLTLDKLSINKVSNEHGDSDMQHISDIIARIERGIKFEVMLTDIDGGTFFFKTDREAFAELIANPTAWMAAHEINPDTGCFTCITDEYAGRLAEACTACDDVLTGSVQQHVQRIRDYPMCWLTNPEWLGREIEMRRQEAFAAADHIRAERSRLQSQYL